MGKGKGGGLKKDPFADLTEDFKAAIDGGDRDAILAVMGKVAGDQHELMEAKELDLDFKEKQEAASEAGAVYRDGTKLNKLKIKYAKLALDTRGRTLKSAVQEVKEAFSKAVGPGGKVTIRGPGGPEVTIVDNTRPASDN